MIMETGIQTSNLGQATALSAQRTQIDLLTRRLEASVQLVVNLGGGSRRRRDHCLVSFCSDHDFSDGAATATASRRS